MRGVKQHTCFLHELRGQHGGRVLKQGINDVVTALLGELKLQPLLACGLQGPLGQRCAGCIKELCEGIQAEFGGGTVIERIGLNLESRVQHAYPHRHVRFSGAVMTAGKHHGAKRLMGGLYQHVFYGRTDRKRPDPAAAVDVVGLGGGQRRVNVHLNGEGDRRAEVRQGLASKAGLDTFAACGSQQRY